MSNISCLDMNPSPSVSYKPKAQLSFSCKFPLAVMFNAVRNSLNDIFPSRSASKRRKTCSAKVEESPAGKNCA